jgi:hypothetical protein
MKRWLTPTLELPLGFVQHQLAAQSSPVASAERLANRCA